MSAKAIPTHLRAQADALSEPAFERKHHGKSQSHMVRTARGNIAHFN